MVYIYRHVKIFRGKGDIFPPKRTYFQGGIFVKNARISSKALAAVLALLMVLSTVIALPAAAVEGAPAVGLKNMVWSYDFSNVGAMSAADTTQYAIDNDLFVLSNMSGGESAVTTDGKGFLKLSASSTIHGNAVVDGLTEETMPMDFFNLYYGLYDGYNTVDSEYIWEFDFRYDGSVTQYRDAETTYNAADGTTVTKLYITDVGYGFFTGRADNQYYALFRMHVLTLPSSKRCLSMNRHG